MELKKDSLGRSKRRRSTGKKIALLSRKEGFEDGFLGFLILIFRVFVFYILSKHLVAGNLFIPRNNITDHIKKQYIIKTLHTQNINHPFPMHIR